MLKRNRFLTQIAVFLSLLGIAPTWSLSPPLKFSWTDTENHWANICLETLGNRKIIQGYPDGTFKPEKTVTRAEFAAMLDGMFSQSVVRPGIEFRDVPENHWASATISRVYQKGLLTGYPNREFKPEQPIPRVQALVALVNSFKYQTPELTPWTWQIMLADEAEIPDYARDGVAAALEQGLVVNYPQKRQLEPNRAATRGEIAAFICQGIRDSAGENIPGRYIVQGILAAEENVPEEVKQRYWEDAAQIALGLLPETEEVELPKDLVSSIYNALILVYSAEKLPGRDEVVEDYQIQALNPNATQILVRVNPEQNWAQAWREGKRLTGNAEIDSLLEKYDLQLESYQDAATVGEGTAILRANQPLNTLALAQQFRNRGVYADVNGIMGANTSISAELKDDAWQLDYRLGYGDCPAGCQWWTTWRFRVSPDLPVEFLGRYGSVPPAPGSELSENIIEGRSTLFTPFGNQPVGNIEPPKARGFSAPIEVLNAQGKQVTIIEPNQEGKFLIRLEPGRYTLRLKFAPQETKYLIPAQKTVTLKPQEYLRLEMQSTEVVP